MLNTTFIENKTNNLAAYVKKPTFNKMNFRKSKKNLTVLLTLLILVSIKTYSQTNSDNPIYSKFDSIYDVFVEITMKGVGILDDLKLPKKTIVAIEEVSSKIKLPSVEIRGISSIFHRLLLHYFLKRQVITRFETFFDF